ncbi:MAG: gliding motility-associated C-terminal domain-containing protein [Chitinophagaceae bacterium]|nr:gliding motility-associated C-terminal domain-containing protein [Chitinophagaceae bacterium]
MCLPGPNVRYTTWLNPQCLKSRSWQVDTSFATIANSEADTAIILQFKKTGSFYLKTLVNNCVVADSLLITVTAPQTSLQLSKQDTLLCPGSSISLTVSPGFRTCRWQDGSSLFAFTVTTPGLYTVTATDSCGNIFADSVRILAADTGFAVQPRYSICPFDSAAVLLPPDAFNISWQPSSSGLLAGNRLLLFPPQTTAYTIRLQRPPGCILQKNTTVAKEDCPEWIKFPSGFTPNNDGLNDVFRPAVSGHPAAYELKIYERNGQLIFATKNPFAGWNGLFKGAAQNSGVFVFICQYRFPGKPETTNKGTFMLVR